MAAMCFENAFGLASDKVIPPVVVPEQMELVAALARAAGYEEYCNNVCAGYVASLDSMLQSVRGHRAVEFAKGIRKAGIGFDSLASFAASLVIENDSVRFNSELDVPSMLGEYWYFPTAEKMVELLDDFYRSSGFHSFYESNKAFYGKAARNMERTLEIVDFSWFEKFFGVPFDKVVVAISFTNIGNYGLSHLYRDGTEVLHPWIGPKIEKDGVPEYDGYQWLIVHEGTHPLTNPLVERYKDEFNDNSDRVAKLKEKDLERMAYKGGMTVLYETLVRACNKKYDLAHAENESDSVDVRDALRRETAKFLMEESFFDALGEYESKRDTYKSIADFMPRLVELHNSLDPDSIYNALVSRAPRIVGFSIGQDSVLNPGKAELTVCFDKPVVYGWGFSPLDGREMPDISWPVHSSDRCVWTSTMELEPDKKYGILFPGWFGSGDRYYSPETLELRFSTNGNRKN